MTPNEIRAQADEMLELGGLLQRSGLKIHPDPDGKVLIDLGMKYIEGAGKLLSEIKPSIIKADRL